MSSPKPKRALSDAEITDAAAQFASSTESASLATAVNKKDLDIGSLQQSVAVLGQGMKAMQLTATSNDNRWSEVATMFDDLTMRQDTTTNTANQLVKDLSGVLDSMRGDQQSMMTLTNETRHSFGQQKAGSQELGESPVSKTRFTRDGEDVEPVSKTN